MRPIKWTAKLRASCWRWRGASRATGRAKKLAVSTKNRSGRYSEIERREAIARATTFNTVEYLGAARRYRSTAAAMRRSELSGVVRWCASMALRRRSVRV
jgi:hypothetical protein